MIFKNGNEKQKVIIVDCECGCGCEFKITDWGDKQYSISLHSSKFDEEQVGVFRIIGRRLKRAFYNLIGKDYLYMDIVIEHKDLNSLIYSLQEIRDNNE